MKIEEKAFEGDVFVCKRKKTLNVVIGVDDNFNILLYSHEFGYFLVRKYVFFYLFYRSRYLLLEKTYNDYSYLKNI